MSINCEWINKMSYIFTMEYYSAQKGIKTDYGVACYDSICMKCLDQADQQRWKVD